MIPELITESVPALTLTCPAFPFVLDSASAKMPVGNSSDAPVPSSVNVPETLTDTVPAFPDTLPGITGACTVDEMLPPEARLKLLAVTFTWPALPDPEVEVVMIP
jgi:hypothetical protein